MIDNDTALTAQQQSLLEALTVTDNIAQAARRASVPDKTARRWAQLPAFQAALAAHSQQPAAKRESAAPEVVTISPATITSQADLGEAARQIAAKAARERHEIEEQVQAARASLALYEEECARLKTARQSRAEQLARLEQIALTASTHHQAAQSYAGVATGTVGEQKALQDVLTAKQQAERALDELAQARAGAADKEQREGERLATLEEMCERERSRIALAGPRLAEVDQVEKRALREFAEAEHATIMAEIARYNHQVAEIRASLVQVQAERLAFLSQAAARLEGQTDLLEDVKREMPPREDATSRIIRAALAYLDQLLGDRRQLKAGLLESPETRAMHHWERLLLIDGSLFAHQSLFTMNEHQLLQARRDQLARVLADYEQAGR